MVECVCDEKKILPCRRKVVFLHPFLRIGEMAERSIAAVLKTVDLRGSGGSNPSLSAKETLQVVNNQSLAAFFFTLVSQLVSHFCV